MDNLDSQDVSESSQEFDQDFLSYEENEEEKVSGIKSPKLETNSKISETNLDS